MQTINVDISDYYRLRGNSGIQRVVKELLPRLRSDRELDAALRVLRFDPQGHVYRVIPEKSVDRLLKGAIEGVGNYAQSITLDELGPDDLFFDFDSAWNTPLKRPALYKTLKQNQVPIWNILYDLSPLLRADLVHENTLRGFIGYLTAVLTYSDLLFCTSRSTERDVLDLARAIGVDRHIPTTTMRLGGDFSVHSDASDPENKDARFNEILNSRFILFVGTIEPRKRHDIALDAFESLATRYDDLNLVLVGKPGWNAEKTTNRIHRHDLKDKRLFWFMKLGDRDLKQLYQKAFVLIYLSAYEGFGLPIVEALAQNKVTIAFDNSSQYEAGMNFADYARLETAREVTAILASYLDSPELYEHKQSYIQEHYRKATWDESYRRIHDVLMHRRSTAQLLSRSLPQDLQFVFISNRVDDLAETIRQHDMRTSLVKEYIVVAPENRIREVEAIHSQRRIIAVNEKKLLGEKYEAFTRSSHVTKNWLLRSSLPNLECLDDEFVMNDDDNRPLVDLDIEFFINQDGTYNAYYFYDLDRWTYRESDYDHAQHLTASHLKNANTERLLYSAHQPQIINKKLLARAVQFVEDGNMELPVDEWSIYFNYWVSQMPEVFRKKPFETMCWPARPSDWNVMVEPTRYTIENYSPDLYQDNEIFGGLGLDDSAEKIERIKARAEKSRLTRQRLAESIQFAREHELVHGMASFERQDVSVYLSSLPILLGAGTNSVVRIDINVKMIFKAKAPKEYRVDAINRSGKVRGRAVYQVFKVGDHYHETVISLPLRAYEAGYDYLTFRVWVDGELVPSQSGPYQALFVIADDSRDSSLSRHGVQGQ